MIQLTPTRKLNIWFRDFRYLEKELRAIAKILVPKRSHKLRMTLSRKDATRLLHNLQGIFWAYYPLELERKIQSADKRAKAYPSGSIEYQLAKAMPRYEAADRVLGLVQNAMNRAWNRGNPNALFFFKPTGLPMRDLIAEALWAKKHGQYLTSTDMMVLTLSKTCKRSEVEAHNQKKLEDAGKLSDKEILALDKKELRERLDWIRVNQPWRMLTEGGGTFVPFE
jgi:hypothetical protein